MSVLFETAVPWLLSILALQGLPTLEAPLRLPRTDDVYFGSVADADLWPDGRTAVLDGMAQEILVFGSDGGLQARLGGKGGGPGELMGAFNLEIGPEGDLLVLDGNAQRITRWGSDGGLEATTPLQEVLPAGSAWPTEFSWNGSGLYIKAISFQPDSPSRILKYHEGLNGSPEVLAEFNEEDEGSPTCDFCTMTVDPRGRVLAAAGDTLYRINLLNPAELPDRVLLLMLTSP